MIWARSAASSHSTGLYPLPETLGGEQLAAVTARAPVVAVSAGAGSGKTTVLVERFVRLVAGDGVSPLEILAITFTERAAAEMKQRIIRSFDAAGDELNRRRAEAAYISTIHGFCARLLRENPLAVGIDPAFGIVDGMRLGLFLDGERELMLQNAWFLQARSLLAPAFGSRRDRLFELIRDCALRPREFGTGATAEETLDEEGHVGLAMQRLDEYVASRWTEARALLISITGDVLRVSVNGPKMSSIHSNVCDMLRALPGLAKPDLLWAAQLCDNTKFTGGIKDLAARAAIKAVLDPARFILKEISGIDRAEQEQLERDHIAPLKVGIYSSARQLRARYDRMKQEQSLLDFEDLQRLALVLLDDSAVRDEYSARFRHILLDEAQDTNSVQKAIIDRILHAGDQQLFAVGDVKQSIYGFRGADVDLFRAIHADAGAGALQLSDNYRSREQILNFVNAVGERLWNDSEFIQYQPLDVRLDYRPSSCDRHVEMLLIDKDDQPDEDGKREQSAQVHHREALAIAQRIRRIVEGDSAAPPLVVFDRHTRSYRSARYADIAILASRRTHFPIYERVLADLGIPVVTNGGRGFFSGREVSDLVMALRVVANPLDEPALLAALRSPLFGWSDDDLVRLRRVGPKGLWRAMQRGFVPNGESADAAAFDTLALLRALAHEVPPVRLLTLLLERTAYTAALLRTSRGRSSAANVLKLLEFARESTLFDGPDLRRFIRRAELAQDYLALEQDAAVAAEGDDVVLLSTIHGSKGLEWPVVILAGLDAKASRPNVGSFFSAADGALVLCPKGEDDKSIAPVSQCALVQAYKDRAEAEARRLLYVALTRAREYLILSGSSKAIRSTSASAATFASPMAWLASALAISRDDLADTEITLDSASVHVSRVIEASVAALRGIVATPEPMLAVARAAVAQSEAVVWRAPDDDRVNRIVTTVRELLAGPPVPMPPTGALAVTTVTKLLDFSRCPLVYYLNLVLQIEEHPRKRRRAETTGGPERKYSALELGTLVHELLERADFTAAPADEAHRLACTDRVGDAPPAERDRIERMLVNVLADPLLDRARRATRVEREYSFHLDLGGTLVHGVIDLLFTERSGSVVVVDYKSNDLAAPDRVNVLSSYYRPQIELYALAASRGGLAQPSEAILYFLNRPIARTFQIDHDRLEAVEANALVTLDRISRGAWDTLPGEKCRNCGYRKRGFCEVGKHFVE